MRPLIGLLTVAVLGLLAAGCDKTVKEARSVPDRAEAVALDGGR